MVAMVFFDEETERICAELDYDLILPSDSLRRHLDSKIVTTKLGGEAGAPSVPNVLDRANSYAELTAKATGAGLGSDLVVQARTATREDHVLHHQPGRVGSRLRRHRRPGPERS